MNIITVSYGSGRCSCRPDTTWERENRDFYVPEGISSLHWAPIAFARICKAGKCIGSKFVQRYYDSVNFGMLLYIGDLMDGSPESLACASCADHSSILPFPLYNRAVFSNPGNTAEISKDGSVIFSVDSTPGNGDTPVLQTIEEGICRASGLISLRTGDFVAAGLAPIAPLASRADGDAAVAATFCGNPLFDFRIIF